MSEIIKDGFLTEQKLYNILQTIFNKVERQKKVVIENKKYRIDFFIPEKDLYIEFDGWRHFSDYNVIRRDWLIDNFLKEKLVRIPYFVQLNSKQIFQHFFSLLPPENVLYNYPHGFIDKKALRPKDFSVFGLERFVLHLDKLPENVVTEIIRTLDEIDFYALKKVGFNLKLEKRKY
jgi:very-short-patch-repair endonuclease